MVMRDNEIRLRLKACLEAALFGMGVSRCEVIQQNQPVPTSNHSAVLFSILSSRRNGWQGVEYDKNTSSQTTMIERWNYVEEIDVQVSAYRPRRVTDGVAELTSVDIVNAIATYFSSPRGNSVLRSKGFMPLRITDVRIPVAQDDSQTPQFNPNFDIRLNILQTADVTIPTVTDIGERGKEFSDGKRIGEVTVHRGGLHGI